ncbi:nuclear transport factor 2 family protein [Streptomyces sp. NPDC050264]|uniref:nuclear transport factor 2 family protein n=1 Tax=Streptomyces sp. NPDC050264 TaxID=3155038 RepID=UPI0034127EB7
MKLRLPTTLICAAAITAALGTTAFAAQSAPSARHHKTKTGIVAQWAAAWNGTEPKALGDLFTADSSYTDQAIGVTMHGREEIAGWKERTDSGIDDVHLAVKAVHRDGHHITVESVYSGQMKGAPKPFTVPAVALLELDGHRIAAEQDFYSLNAVLAQSGLPADWTPPAS